jgi:hypothetical protein
MPVIPTTWEAKVGGSWSEAGQNKSTRSYLKNKLTAKELLSKCKALSSIPSTAYIRVCVCM